MDYILRVSASLASQDGGGGAAPRKGKYPDKAWLDPRINKTRVHRLRETWRLPHRPSPSADVMVGGLQHGDLRAEAVGLRQMRGDRASWLLVGVGVGAAKGYPPQRNISTAVWGQTSPGAIFLLGLRNPQGPLEAEVTQTPRHLIKTTGQTATLRCSPISGHSSVSWYQQAQSQGPQFIYEFYETLQRAKGNFSNRFLAKQFPDFSSELNVNSLDLTDSALYLCASSLAQLC
uniref:Ig-like domain-containing protein n=1 Tax=Bos mutus grunniens TaxID=30521 RepID=A0A8B9W9V8_BOSMU